MPGGSTSGVDGANYTRQPEQQKSSKLGVDLASACPWCMLLLDASSRITYANAAAELLFELNDGSECSKDFLTLWPQSELETIGGALASAAGGMPSQYSAFCPNLNGLPRWLEVAVTPVGGTDGTAGSVLCTIRDITQQVAVQESLKNSQQRFRALADHMAQLAWMADETGHLYWYNKRWLDYTGTTMTEMEGWGWTKVHHPEHLDRVVQKWASHIHSGEVWEDIFPLRGSDGTYRWFLSRAMPFRDANGRITLWCGTNTDITEQRNATQRLRQKARLIELSHEAIFSWDLDGAILSWNRGCEELYGYSQTEAIGACSHELLKSQHPVPIGELHQLLLADGAWSGEILHFAKDGTKVWVDSRHELLRVGGKSIVLETNRDITERRKSDEIRNLLVAELNHRVKNTLAIVQSIASQTARSSFNMREYAASFRGRLQALANAHNVLTDSHWYGADLHKLVESEIDVTFGRTAAIETRGEHVFLSPQTALHFTLILHELASNALKHGALSRPSGRVDVTWHKLPGTKQLEFVWRERGGPSVLEPKFKGFGTSLIGRTASLPNIKSALTFEPEGVVCRIVADLQDDASAAPLMFNPVRSELPLAMAPRTSNGQRSTSPRVLIIEAEPFLALELHDSLTEAGFQPVGPATTMQSALEAIARGGNSAVILDASNYPAAQIGVVVEKIKTAELPYVVIGVDEKSPAMQVAGVPVLKKPVRSFDLIRALGCAMSPPQRDTAW